MSISVVSMESAVQGFERKACFIAGADEPVRTTKRDGCAGKIPSWRSASGAVTLAEWEEFVSALACPSLFPRWRKQNRAHLKLDFLGGRRPSPSTSTNSQNIRARASTPPSSAKFSLEHPLLNIDRPPNFPRPLSPSSFFTVRSLPTHFPSALYL